ncbi:MAG: AGE family epimerase/isomerase [Oscillospiraceae bacterium]|nr:AGE family epimerase/isomerase [Oscillospiraceae bacterium]
MKNEKELKQIYDWAENEMKDLMDMYIKHAYDPEGGFYGEVTRELVPIKDADRAIVLNARLLWTFASAYRVMKDPRYLDMANHAKAYIQKYFIDPEYGGSYWHVHADGSPADETKYPYGISFIIYGGAELARASGDKDAAAMARKMYDDLEKYALDKVYGGYFEAFTRDWKRRDVSFNIRDLSMGSKALNTHLHLIESYTNLMRVDDDPLVREKVGSLIDIMTTKLLDLEHFHYKPYMLDDWGATDTLFSYGHDIEGAWLLTEALEAYGDEELFERHKDTSVRIAAACEAGLNPETGGIYYEGNENGPHNLEMSHWVQAEAVIGFINAYQLTDDDRYLKLAQDIIQYIKDYISDREGGVFREWLFRADVSAHKHPNILRVNKWKEPYHNGRMCLELIERINRILAGA